ncbi:hypothetical protein ACOMHN_065876 [Nucella lapillus]
MFRQQGRKEKFRQQGRKVQAARKKRSSLYTKEGHLFRQQLMRKSSGRQAGRWAREGATLGEAGRTRKESGSTTGTKPAAWPTQHCRAAYSERGAKQEKCMAGNPPPL